MAHYGDFDPLKVILSQLGNYDPLSDDDPLKVILAHLSE
jgi:hypothetical protein